MELTNSQVDRLGERLKKAEVVAAEDAAMYQEFRALSANALDFVTVALESELRVRVVSRLKTLDSTVAKLRRQSIRLSRIGDLAGCRFTVENLAAQDAAVRGATAALPGSRVNDVRDAPHSGYRAVHLYSRVNGRTVEIQVRTRRQDRWANLCEALASRVGIGIKYGAGPEPLQTVLLELSERSHELDVAESLGAATGDPGATGKRDPGYQHEPGSAAEVRAAWRRLGEQFDTQVDMLLAEFVRGHSL